MIAGSNPVQLNLARQSFSRLQPNTLDVARLLLKPDASVTLDSRRLALTQVMTGTELNLHEKLTVLTYLGFDQSLKTEVGSYLKSALSHDNILLMLASPIRQSIKKDIVQELANRGALRDGTTITDLDAARDILTVLCAVGPYQTGANMIFHKLFPGESAPKTLPLIGAKPANGGKVVVPPPLPQAAPGVNTVDDKMQAPLTAIKDELSDILKTVGNLIDGFKKVEEAMSKHARGASVIKKQYEKDPEYTDAVDRLNEILTEIDVRQRALGGHTQNLGNLMAPIEESFHGRTFDRTALKPVEWQFQVSLLPDDIKKGIYDLGKGIENVSRRLILLVDSFQNALPPILESIVSEKEVEKNIAGFQHVPEVVRAHEHQKEKNNLAKIGIKDAQTLVWEITTKIEELRMTANHQVAAPAVVKPVVLPPIAPPPPPIRRVVVPPPLPPVVTKPATPPPTAPVAPVAPSVPLPAPKGLPITTGDFEAFGKFINASTGAMIRARLADIVNWLKMNSELGNTFDKLADKMKGQSDDALGTAVRNEVGIELGKLAQTGNLFATNALTALIESSPDII